MIPGISTASPTAISRPFQFVQPDGSEVTLVFRGTAERHWEETVAGYTVVRVGNSVEYAQAAPDGTLTASGRRAGIDPTPAGLGPGLLPPGQRRKGAYTFDPDIHPMLNRLSSGKGDGPLTLKNLVVLIRFADHADRDLPSREHYDTLFNQVGGDAGIAPSGSIRDIWNTNSLGQLIIESTVADWVTVSETERYYADGESGLPGNVRESMSEALDQLDLTLDFSEFDEDGDGKIDAITFVHSGYGAEWGRQDCQTGNGTEDRIWSHKSGFSWQSTGGVRVGPYNINPGLWAVCGNSIGRVGVIAHELGHFLGLPDLYSPEFGTAGGIGHYGLMSSSGGATGSQQPPPLLSAWSKVRLGFVEPQELTSAGFYTLTGSNVLVIREGYMNYEYLLVERRRRLDDQDRVVDNIPRNCDGVAIWHIDDANPYHRPGHPGQPDWPANGNHNRVSLLQADGDYALEQGQGSRCGDLYSTDTVTEIGPQTVPSTDAYQFGIIQPTGHVLSDISEPGDVMSLCFNQQGCVDPTIEYLVNITGGSGDGRYLADTRIVIIAESPVPGEEFVRWDIVQGNAEIDDPFNTQTQVVVGTQDVVIQARFEGLLLIDGFE